MTVVDQHGRVLGRWNVLDVALGLVLLFLIPLLYGGYLLFRPQPATLTAIEPSRLHAGTDVDATVRGTNLRPYMRVSFNERQGRSFMFVDATQAVVTVTDLPPGVYDVILYDQAQERARLPRALEVIAVPRPQVTLDLIGSFTGIAEPLLSRIKANLALDGLGHVREVGAPVPSQTRTAVGPGELQNLSAAALMNVPAIVRANCVIANRGGSTVCVALDTSLTRDAVLTVTAAGSPALFQIDQVRAAGDGETADVRVRFAGERAVVERLQVGDRDQPRRNMFATGATIAQLSGATRATSAVVIAAPLRSQGEAPVVLAGDVVTVDALLRIPVQSTPDGWSYNGQLLKAGRALVFHGHDVEVNGVITGIALSRAK